MLPERIHGKARLQAAEFGRSSTYLVAEKADTMYVEALIGRDTVNTLPPSTMGAFRDHSITTPDAAEHDVAGARATLDETERLGISQENVAKEQATDGVKQFAAALDKVLAAVTQTRTPCEGDRSAMLV